MINMTDKQQQKQQQTQPTANETYECNTNDLLNEFTRMEEVIDVIKKINLESKLTYDVRHVDQYTHKHSIQTNSINDIYVDYVEPMVKKKRLRFIENCTTRDGSWRTLDSLVAAGTISKEELRYFPDEQIPSRKIVQLYRVKQLNGEENIIRFEEWKGLSRSGGIVNLTGWFGSYVEPAYTTEFQPVERDNPTGPTVRVAKLGLPQAATYAGTKRYIEKYTPERIRFYLDHMKGRPGVDHSYGLMKESESNPTVVKDTEQFVSGDFNALWQDLTTVKPTVDIKELVKELRKPDKETEHEVYS